MIRFVLPALFLMSLAAGKALNFFGFLFQDDTATVTARQEKVLKQLEDLKAQLGQIRAGLGVCGKTFQHTTAFQNGGLKEVNCFSEILLLIFFMLCLFIRQIPLQDVVINGHPNFIPYALLALKNAWRDLYTIDVKTFTHSTMADIGPAAREFEANLAKVPVNPALPKINITLIWKNCVYNVGSTKRSLLYRHLSLFQANTPR